MSYCVVGHPRYVPGVREAHVTPDLPVRVQIPRLERPLDAPRQDVVVALAFDENRLGTVVGGPVDADAAGIISPMNHERLFNFWLAQTQINEHA